MTIKEREAAWEYSTWTVNVSNSNKKLLDVDSSLIFGVTGQDGSYLAEQLLADNHKVIGVARRCSHDCTERLQSFLYHPNFTLIEGDITDCSNVLSIINGNRPEHIYNLAAMSHVHTSFSQPGHTWDVVAKGVLNILEALKYLKQTQSYSPRLLQASSSEMFGDKFNLSWDGQKVQYEATQMNPQSPYAIAKLAAYNFVRLYRKSYGIFASNAVSFNHESERRGQNFVTKKVTDYVARLYHHSMNRGSPESFHKLKLGNLKASRDWGFAGDFTKGFRLIINHNKADDFVLATGKTHTVEDFVHQAFHCIGINDWKFYVEIDQALVRPAEVEYLKGCAGKAQELLGWEPTVSFEKLVDMMVQCDIERYRDAI
jgi:GDPmannose 4,6-dehydratase